MKKSIDIIVKVFIPVILIIIVLITSFESGKKYYNIINNQFNSSNANINSNIAKWNFKVSIIY